jgi:hypothetical protein
MFGLTYREQRWAAEQKAAECLLDLAKTAIQARAEIAVAEAQTDAAELTRLRAETAKLRAAAGQASFCLRTLCPDDADAQMTVRMLHEALGTPVPVTPNENITGGR